MQNILEAECNRCLSIVENRTRISWGYLFKIQRAKDGHKNSLGIDNYFKSRAIIDKKIIKGLETIEQSLSSYLYHDQVDQDLFMRFSLKELKEKEWLKMPEAWRNGDINFF